ncbi:hypothetical protein MJG53_005757 [Ovis ammon polii x Ovis aries]|uniref:Uncharacterized protein n=1 Tax=Ovis ammon polii x Ovis aries TaxID=2918886 RepID=A0ACB9V719_9CETA|nr:hypothetical protein MJG53_005757 [Ovis ammon polii x Ovis aries]
MSTRSQELRTTIFSTLANEKSLSDCKKELRKEYFIFTVKTEKIKVGIKVKGEIGEHHYLGVKQKSGKGEEAIEPVDRTREFEGAEKKGNQLMQECCRDGKLCDLVTKNLNLFLLKRNQSLTQILLGKRNCVQYFNCSAFSPDDKVCVLFNISHQSLAVYLTRNRFCSSENMTRFFISPNKACNDMPFDVVRSCNFCAQGQDGIEKKSSYRLTVDTYREQEMLFCYLKLRSSGVLWIDSVV